MTEDADTGPRRSPRRVAALLIAFVAAAIAFGLGRADRPVGPGQPAGVGTGPSPVTTQVLGGHGTGTGSATSTMVTDFAIRGAVQELYPGVQRAVMLTFTNPDCPGSLLSFGPLTPVTVPARAQATATLNTSLSVYAGEACRGVSWPLTHSGTAVTS